MTALTKPVIRETSARDRGRPIVVELNAHELVFREKGRRRRIALPIMAALHLAYKLAAREAAQEKKRGRR
jgi:hypothetical protein